MCIRILPYENDSLGLCCCCWVFLLFLWQMARFYSFLRLNKIPLYAHTKYLHPHILPWTLTLLPCLVAANNAEVEHGGCRLLFFLNFIVIHLQLSAFSPHPSTPPQTNPPPSPLILSMCPL